MKYIISYSKPHRRYVNIEFIADQIDSDELTIQLPVWRPGRYELGSFAKNIQQWAAFDAAGNALAFQKTSKDTWKVATKDIATVHIKYNYFANELNAGSTFIDDTQLYVNPVNCCLYIPNRINEPCTLDIIVPEDFQLAIGNNKSKSTNGFNCSFTSFHDLADNPFIASNTLQHDTYDCGAIKFHVWIHGECKPDWTTIKKDFKKFSEVQLKTMEYFPNKEFHFLIHILPYRAYHGVEHTTSTMITLGPGHALMKTVTYEDLLGVCSHELFHVWNIKTIRPIEMQPYDYAKENYSKLGYVAEGVTTYYGDLFLFRSKVFNREQYFKTFNERLQRHYDNYGRFNLSVADSSFDTWLDGYVKGIPNRKTSIYGEGCLLAFISDLFIQKNSNNKYSLDDVMRYLNNNYALKGIGYSDLDYKAAIEHFAQQPFDNIFDNFINGTADFSPLLKEYMDYVGCELNKTAAAFAHENKAGFKVSENSGTCKVLNIAPNSPADIAGLTQGDEIIAIDKMQVRAEGTGNNFGNWFNYFAEDNDEVIINIVRQKQVKAIVITLNDNGYYPTMVIKELMIPNAEQQNNFNIWTNNNL